VHPQKEGLAPGVVEAERPRAEHLREGDRFVLLPGVRLADAAPPRVAVIRGALEAG
jgi:orotidine-5'-phosphate decarboxylase